jgi:hypothetical protein
MTTIYKYPFPIVPSFTLSLPRGHRILSAEMQGDQPCLWALVDPAAPKVTENFRLVCTGHPIPEFDNGVPLGHVATFQMPPFVWHLFRVLRLEDER